MSVEKVAGAWGKARYNLAAKAVSQLEIRISLVRFFGPTASNRTRASGPIIVAQPTQA